MKQYENYHKHTHLSNVFIKDTPISPSDYIDRIKEIGGDTYYTTEHGWGGDIFEARTLCDKANMKCIFGMEGYIVPKPPPDPLSDAPELPIRDKSNYHIVVIPRTNKARRKLNIASSNANELNYYYKPRLLLSDLLDFDPNDLFITTACIGGILKTEEAIDGVFKPLYEHFKNNLFVEVQPHHMMAQVEHNKKCLEIAKKYRLPIIAATDSHYIYPIQIKDRNDFLKGKGLRYDDEDGMVLDYPDHDQILKRFVMQGVLSSKEAEQALEQTLIMRECEEIQLDKRVKMPPAPKYRNCTPEEKCDALENIIKKEYQRRARAGEIPKEKLDDYRKALKDELQVVRDTSEVNTADYFLYNYEVVKRAKEKGGVLTRTGRGSGGCFLINNFLGITQIDRLNVNIPLYPERFMSTARILEAHSLPDIDFNVVEQKPFVDAAKELSGERGVYPMLAYGTMAEGEAFRNECRSRQIPFTEFNEIGKNLDAYKDDEKWGEVIQASQRHMSTIYSASIHPCSFLLFDGDIRKEMGVIRVNQEICAAITSSEADEYKYLKDDFLVVTVWKIINEVCKKAGIEIPKLQDLTETTKDDKRVWDLYAKGVTSTLNQIDSDYATQFMRKYKASSIEELQMFIAAIRPSFNSWRKEFLERSDYKYDIPSLDELLKPTHSFLLFQETLMQFFDWLGVTPEESITLIKKISKKKIKQEDFDALETRIKEQWKINTGSYNKFDEVWHDVQSCMAYGFNAPHAYATAVDSLYGAYLKVNYPCEYYTVCLNVYEKNERKTRELIKELKYFGIKLQPPKFGYASDEYMINKKEKTITKGAASIKGLNKGACRQLFRLSKERTFGNFSELILALSERKILQRDQIETLIKLDYFSAFGNSKALMKIYEFYVEKLKQFKVQRYKKENFTDEEFNLLKEYLNNISEVTGKELSFYQMTNKTDVLKSVEVFLKEKYPEDYSFAEKIKFQDEKLGYIDLTTNRPQDRTTVYVSDVSPINNKFKGGVWKYRVDIRSLGTGNSATVYCPKSLYDKAPFEKGGVIKCTKKLFKDNGYWNLTGYKVLSKGKEAS